MIGERGFPVFTIGNPGLRRDWTMNMISTLKDFFDGLSRGFGLFLFERNEHVQRTVAPGLDTVSK